MKVVTSTEANYSQLPNTIFPSFLPLSFHALGLTEISLAGKTRLTPNQPSRISCSHSWILLVVSDMGVVELI